MKNYLITGGAGFIGSNFIRMMLAQPDVHIVNYDALTYAGNRANLADVETNRSYSFVQGDVRDEGKVREMITQFGVEIIVNFAAETHVDRSITGAAPFIETNVDGVRVLLDAARECGVRRFLQVSTDEVYGSIEPGDYADESSPLRCGSPYAASKAAADLLCLAYHNTYKFPVVISRCSNNYGPYQHPEKLLPLAISRALRGQSIPVYGDGLHRRDWLHVEDHCAALRLLLERGRDGQVYNIAAGEERTNLDTVRALLSVIGAPESLVRFVADRPGHDRRYAMNASRIREACGWQPAHTFIEGLSATVSWYRDHQEWMRNILEGEYKRYFVEQYSHIEH